MAPPPEQPVYFTSSARWRQWLKRRHATEPLLWVGFHKRATGRPSLTWPESVDQALCFGWIDGIRKRVDDERYLIRFSPRRPGSIWSAVNTKRVAELTAAGLMEPAGRRVFESRDPRKTSRYSFEQAKGTQLSPDLAAILNANRKARQFFEAQAPWYQRTASWFVMSAKKDQTRARRLALLIDHSARGQRIPPLGG